MREQEKKDYQMDLSEPTTSSSWGVCSTTVPQQLPGTYPSSFRQLDLVSAADDDAALGGGDRTDATYKFWG